MAELVLITGPPGAGKSTVSKNLLQDLPGEWAYVSQDDLRQMVVKGYASADDYDYNWSQSTKRQWMVSIPICVDIAKRYLDSGINCLVDFSSLPEQFEVWKTEIGDVPYRLFILLPNEETVVNRNEHRKSISRLKDKKVRLNHKAFLEWAKHGVSIIDTSSDDIKQSVLKIKKLVLV